MVKFTASKLESKLIQHIVARYVALVERLSDPHNRSITRFLTAPHT